MLTRHDKTTLLIEMKSAVFDHGYYIIEIVHFLKETL